MVVLALNSGSSSLKFGLYRANLSAIETLVSGEATALGDALSRFTAHDGNHQTVVSESTALSGQRDAVERIARLLSQLDLPSAEAVGHRVVHGGPALREHCVIDDDVLAQLEAASTFAPLHAPAALSVIRFSLEHFPGLPQVACFDTSFHRSLPELARVLPLPRELLRLGIQRYGFHGLSCESILRQLVPTVAAQLPERLIIVHLGNGASVTAVRCGQSVDTTMGLTPSGGALMGTRSGDLDPGVLIHLMRIHHFDAAMLESMVDRRSGLLGISDVSSDMRRLHEAAPGNANARLAIDMFCSSVRKHIAGMITVLDGVDAIVFTGGIGENDVEVRAAICAGLSFMGVKLDLMRNQSVQNPISSADSRCAVHVLPSEEDPQIARHTWDLCAP